MRRFADAFIVMACRLLSVSVESGLAIAAYLGASRRAGRVSIGADRLGGSSSGPANKEDRLFDQMPTDLSEYNIKEREIMS